MTKVNSKLSGSFGSDWKIRHLCVIIIAALGTYAFLESRAGWSEMHRWNRAVGDMSLLMVALAMLVGPISRLRKGFKKFIPWRRELGIYGVLLAIIHVAIILDAWVEWDWARLFGYEVHPLTGQYVMLQQGFGLANSIGIVALFYAIALALTSNDWSQKKLGGITWKFLQQGAYVYWVLIVTHTAYFLYLHFQDFHRQVPDPNWAQLPLAIIVLLVVLLQFSAFVKTWKLKSKSV